MDWLSAVLLPFVERLPWLTLALVCAALLLIKMVFGFLLRLVRGYEPSSTQYCPNCSCEKCTKVRAAAVSSSSKDVSARPGLQ